MTDIRARVVLLGASNVTKGISIITETAQLLLGSPLDIHCAIGHGRSYGMKSFVLVRSLPSIVHSQLWQAIEQPTDAPMYALIADVGNDVMYGVPPDQIIAWVDQCAQRLLAMNARIVMTSLPMQRVARLTKQQYLLARTVLFPTNRLSFESVKQRAAETAAGLQLVANEHGVALVELPATWYGVDPIHIRASLKARAWQQVLRHWVDDASPLPPPARGSLKRWLTLRSSSPSQWWLAGIQRGRAQPATVLRDGTRFSMY